MAKLTTLEQLIKRHDKATASIVTKRLNNIGQINPNDIIWLLHDPQLNKQLGRSKRVFLRLTHLDDLAAERKINKA